MTKSIDERRAEFVSDASRLMAIATGAPVVPPIWADRSQGFREKFIPVILDVVNGNIQTPERCHEIWMEAMEKMGWVYGPERDESKKTHPDMVPWDQLHPKEQAKDEIFFDLCKLAAKWIK